MTASVAGGKRDLKRYTAAASDEDRTELTSHAAIHAAIEAWGRADGLFELALQMALVSEPAQDGHFSQVDTAFDHKLSRAQHPQGANVLSQREMEVLSKTAAKVHRMHPNLRCQIVERPRLRKRVIKVVEQAPKPARPKSGTLLAKAGTGAEQVAEQQFND